MGILQQYSLHRTRGERRDTQAADANCTQSDDHISVLSTRYPYTAQPEDFVTVVEDCRQTPRMTGVTAIRVYLGRLVYQCG